MIRLISDSRTFLEIPVEFRVEAVPDHDYFKPCNGGEAKSPN